MASGRAGVSQGVFARYLNVPSALVSQWTSTRSPDKGRNAIARTNATATTPLDELGLGDLDDRGPSLVPLLGGGDAGDGYGAPRRAGHNLRLRHLAHRLAGNLRGLSFLSPSKYGGTSEARLSGWVRIVPPASPFHEWRDL